MSLKKKTRKFGNELAEVMGDNCTLVPDMQAYVMAHAMITLLVDERGPEAGLNAVFESIAIAAAEQGYRLLFGNQKPETMH